MSDREQLGGPQGWKRTTLGEALPIHYGKARNDRHGTVRVNTPVYGSSGRIDTFNRALTSGPSLIIGRKGNVGAAYYSPEPCWPIDTVYFAEASAHKDLRFFKYLLDHLQLARMDRSTAVPGLSRDDYNAKDVFIPELDQQLLIVAEIEKQFSRLDEAVGNLRRVKANLKRYKASVLKAAVEGKLTEAWRKQHPDVEPASKLLERILAERRAKWSGKGKYKELPIPDTTILPRLPQTWTWSSVETICSDVVDCPHSTPKWQATGRVCLRTTEFRPGRLDLSDVRYVSQATYEARIQRLTPRENDIVYSREGGILGLACMIPARLNPCLGQRMMLLRSHALFSPNLLMYWLNSPDLLARVRSLTGGSASPHLNVGEVKSFPVPVTPVAELNAIVAEVERRLSVIEELEAAVEANLTRADRLRQSVLGDAFSGKLVRATV